MAGTREPVAKAGDVVEGRYRVLKTLGEGGMGTVFLAEHELIKRRVALKILHPELATDAEVIERFMNEARAAGTLGHPNIVESTDMGFTHDGVPYIVFEFLEGALLTDEIYRVGGFTVRRAVRIAQQIASALHAAHTASIVHRDLKSDNVFLTDKDDALDHVKVLDFGISRFLALEDDSARRGVVMGTPEFMSPEQITAPDQVDRRTDVYALGVILYEMLTARRPFCADDDPRALLDRIVHTAPPPLGRDDVPHALSELILRRMLAKDPADRVASMSDVEAALASFATQREVGGLRRNRPSTLPVAATTGVAGELAQPAEREPRALSGAARRQGRDDTEEPIALADASGAPAQRRPWALYVLAGGGLAIGALGVFIGGRGAEPGAQPPVVAIAPALPAVPAPAPAAQPAAPAAAFEPRTVSKVELKLDANVAGARVTFRRRVIPAPATMEITESDIVELVEVAAPGYQTQRYWLTFDRPTHLIARLVKGAGLHEATEEDTLVALGELVPPAEPTVVAAVPRAPVRRAPARRRTGRSAAASGSVAASPSALDAAEPAPAGEVVAAAPARGAAETATGLATEPGSTVEPEPAFVHEPVAAHEPAAVSEPARRVDGAEALRALAGAHHVEVERCFSDGRQRAPGLAGTLVLELRVSADGVVHHVQPRATFEAPLVVACAVAAAGGWTFPVRPGAEPVTVAVAFAMP